MSNDFLLIKAFRDYVIKKILKEDKDTQSSNWFEKTISCEDLWSFVSMFEKEIIEKKDDNLIHRPQHYGNFTPIDSMASGLFTKEETRGYLKGNLIKYISRYRSKNGIEDLEKAEEYLKLLKMFEEGKNIVGE